jgi:hypothetical protein
MSPKANDQFCALRTHPGVQGVGDRRALPVVSGCQNFVQRMGRVADGAIADRRSRQGLCVGALGPFGSARVIADVLHCEMGRSGQRKARTGGFPSRLASSVSTAVVFLRYDDPLLLFLQHKKNFVSPSGMMRLICGPLLALDNGEITK